MKKIFIIISFLCSLNISRAERWVVAPNSEYQFCSQVASLVQDNDTIFIESASYNDDIQVTWRKNNLFIKGINGKPELIAGNKILNDKSNGKGIFVIQGSNTVIENIKFRNSKVLDNNGAGIRQEGKNLTVRNCSFNNNEMGILQGGTIQNCSILVEYCDFENNGSPNNPGYQHNIYINHIDSLIFRFNSSINASSSGHELKSRANFNFIEYNRISNISSVDSRNIDIPNGGTTIILGNIIEQGENSENSNLIGYGMEGASNPAPHNLYLINNTVVNYKSKGNFISVKDANNVVLKNNIFVGSKTGGFLIGNFTTIDTTNNFINDKIPSVSFKSNSIMDYELNSDSPAINAGTNLNEIVMGHNLNPEYEYIINSGIKKRFRDNQIDIGAREVINTNIVEDFGNFVSFYPNPAKDYIELNINVASIIGNCTFNSIKIFNILGEEVLLEQFEFNNNDFNKRIDISNLPEGFYFVKLGNLIKNFVINNR